MILIIAYVINAIIRITNKTHTKIVKWHKFQLTFNIFTMEYKVPFITTLHVNLTTTNKMQDVEKRGGLYTKQILTFVTQNSRSSNKTTHSSINEVSLHPVILQ